MKGLTFALRKFAILNNHSRLLGSLVLISHRDSLSQIMHIPFQSMASGHGGVIRNGTGRCTFRPGTPPDKDSASMLPGELIQQR